MLATRLQRLCLAKVRRSTSSMARRTTRSPHLCPLRDRRRETASCAWACEKRQAWDSGLQKPVLLSLHNMLLRLDGTGVVNPYAHWYKHMHEKMQEQEARGILPDVALRFRSGSTPDPPRYN